jgi:ferritin-like metal-binding protein YciE
MPISNKEVFVRILSQARKNSAQSAELYRQFGKVAENFELKQHLETLAFISETDVTSMDHFFERVGEKPVDPPFRLEDAFAPDFKGELSQMQTSTARQLYILVKATELGLHRMAEYPMLISAAELTGYEDVSALLKTILKHRLAFLEQDRRLVRGLIESRVAETSRLAVVPRTA